jgi:hypothetical protein
MKRCAASRFLRPSVAVLAAAFVAAAAYGAPLTRAQTLDALGHATMKARPVLPRFE